MPVDYGKIFKNSTLDMEFGGGATLMFRKYEIQIRHHFLCVLLNFQFSRISLLLFLLIRPLFSLSSFFFFFGAFRSPLRRFCIAQFSCLPIPGTESSIYLGMSKAFHFRAGFSCVFVLEVPIQMSLFGILTFFGHDRTMAVLCFLNFS